MVEQLDEEEVLIWQDVLDEVVAGRTRSLRCPLCPPNKSGEVQVSKDEVTRRTRLQCNVCRRFIEVRLNND